MRQYGGMREKSAVSHLLWVALALEALSLLFFAMVFIDGEGFLGPMVLAAILIALVAFVLSIVGTVRSRRKTIGVIAVVISAVCAFGPPLFLLFAIIYSNLN